MTQIQSQT